MKTFKKINVIKNITSTFFANFHIKLFCLLLAIAMYISISIFQQNAKAFSSKLKLEGLKDYLVISDDLHDIIKITAKDKAEAFEKITEDDFNVHLDLGSINKPGKYQIKLKYDVPKTMQSFFSSIKIEPEEMTITIDRLSEKKVSVDVNLIGSPMQGYALKTYLVQPSIVRIQGPEALVNKIDQIKTETINIEGAKESFTRRVNLVSDYHTIKILDNVDILFEIIPEPQ